MSAPPPYMPPPYPGEPIPLATAPYPMPQEQYPPIMVANPQVPAAYPAQVDEKRPYPTQPPGQVIMTQPTTTTTVVVNQSFGSVPVRVACMYCQNVVVTRLKYETGCLTWLVAGGLCLVGCDCGCCLIPFCVDSCKDVEHSCPNCNRQLGRFSRL